MTFSLLACLLTSSSLASPFSVSVSELIFNCSFSVSEARLFFEWPLYQWAGCLGLSLSFACFSMFSNELTFCVLPTIVFACFTHHAFFHIDLCGNVHGLTFKCSTHGNQILVWITVISWGSLSHLRVFSHFLDELTFLHTYPLVIMKHSTLICLFFFMFGRNDLSHCLLTSSLPCFTFFCVYVNWPSNAHSAFLKWGSFLEWPSSLGAFSLICVFFHVFWMNWPSFIPTLWYLWSMVAWMS